MKRLCIVVIFLTFLICPVANAFDGELYFGKFFESNLRAYSDGGKAKFIGGVEVGHKIKFLRPYVKLETLMDECYQGSTVPYFHPSSIKYDVGVKLFLPKDIYIEVSHMCWHPIDGKGVVEQYHLLKVGVKFGKPK